MDQDSRAALHRTVSSALSQRTDDELRRELASATPLGDGIGGDAAVLSVAGTNVFVKHLPLTDVEQQPQIAGTTSNIFSLPMHCHYGVGAPSTGAWRELSAHKITSDWVVNGKCDAFPVLHHWRVLAKDRPATLHCAEHGDVETWIKFWHGSDAVRRRLKALSEAPADLVLFLEYIPRTLAVSLEDSLGLGAEAIDAMLGRVEAQLMDLARFMAAEGLWHFDAHLKNILADDDRLYLSDFGLAASSSFDLTATEARFLVQHVEHDVAYLVTQLVNWIAMRLTNAGRHWTHPRERNEYVRRVASGDQPAELTPRVAGLLKRYSPVAAVMNDFYFALHGTSRLTPYPAAALHDACRASGIELAKASS